METEALENKVQRKKLKKYKRTFAKGITIIRIASKIKS